MDSKKIYNTASQPNSQFYQYLISMKQILISTLHFVLSLLAFVSLLPENQNMAWQQTTKSDRKLYATGVDLDGHVMKVLIKLATFGWNTEETQCWKGM